MTKSMLLGTSALLSALAAAPAVAAPVLWTLSGVTFEDGATATGSFSFDADINVITGVSISTSGGSYLSPMSYVSSSNAGTIGNSSFFFFTDGLQFLRLSTVAGLTNAGGVVGIDTSGNSYECVNCSPYRFVTSGSLVAEATQAPSVPEPATWSLMVLGFGAAGFGLRARRRVQVAFG